MNLQTRRELFKLVLNLKLPKDKEEEYLKYLFNQHPLMSEEYVEIKDHYHDREFKDSTITCVDESYPLKSFFQGKEGVNIFYQENGCFENSILKDLPEQYSPRKGLSAIRFGLKNETIIIPGVSFQPSVDILIQSESFSLHEMLCIFIEGIKMTEKHFLRKKEFTNDSEALLDMIYKPSKPFFSISKGITYCYPLENGEFMPKFGIYYYSRKKAWGINFYNGGD